VLDSTDGAEVQRIEIGEEYISSVAFGPDSKHVVISTYGPHAKVAVWNVRTGERLVEMSGLDSAMSVEKVVASNDGKRLAGILGGKGYGTKAEVIVWDAATGKSLFTLPGHSGQFANVAFSRNGRRIATADTGNELMTLKDLNHNTAQSLAFNADGTKLFAVAPVGRGPVKKIEIRTWDATPRE
jgi:WD40 repeat protein